LRSSSISGNVRCSRLAGLVNRSEGCRAGRLPLRFGRIRERMTYPYDFPASSQDEVEREIIRARRDLEQQKEDLSYSLHGPSDKLERLVLDYILRIVCTFATKAMKLGWGMARAQRESLSILQSLTITAPEEIGRDRWGNKISNLTSGPFSEIRPEVQRKLEKSQLWHRLEDILLGHAFENAPQGEHAESGLPGLHGRADEPGAQLFSRATGRSRIDNAPGLPVPSDPVKTADGSDMETEPDIVFTAEKEPVKAAEQTGNASSSESRPELSAAHSTPTVSETQDAVPATPPDVKSPSSVNSAVARRYGFQANPPDTVR